MSPKLVQQIAIKAVIPYRGKLLLLRESSAHDTNFHPNRYQFPGGRLNRGESWVDGLHREIAEETGMTVEIGEPLYIGEWFPTIKGVPHQIVAVFLVCTPKSVDVRLSDEHDGYQWMTLKQSRTFDLMPPDDLVVEKYFEKYHNNQHT